MRASPANPPPVPPPSRTLLIDAAGALGLAVFLSVATGFALHGQPSDRPFDAWAVVLVVVAAGALAARRLAPVAVLFTVLGATLAYRGLGYANGPIWIALLVAYVGAVIRGHRVAAVIVAIVGFVAFPFMDAVFHRGPGPSVVGVAALAAWLLVLLGVGEWVRIRRERSEDAVRRREEERLRRASEERLRIARELHDALGHHLSLINVQSGVALHLNDRLPDQARESLTAIKQASKEALAELRSVLDILRQDDERAPRSPTSTLARLDDLVSQAHAAGLEVRTETDGVVRPVPFGVDVAAFRIVQEALTNVARHAAPATAVVRLSYGDRDLTVQVDDDGRGPGDPAPAGGGRGIVGMRERVAAFGGELRTGRRPDGGFRVWARLPLGEAS
ncbi:MAG TPA: sensor histidine kinase [Actinomycetota bacterium]|jgi:signal transduction histidine kinase